MNIVDVSQDMLEKVIDYSFEVNSLNTSRVRGISKDYQVFKNNFEKYLKNKEDRILLLKDNERFLGVLLLGVEESEKYIEAIGVFTKEEYSSVFSIFMEYLKKHYKGYQFDIAYPKENIQAINTLKSVATKCEVTQYEFEVRPEYFPNIELSGNIVPLEEKHYEAVRKLHDGTFKEVYWTADRLFQTKRFDVFVALRNDEVVGEIVTSNSKMKFENIFFISTDKDYRRQGIATGLYARAITHCFNKGKERVMLQVDEDNTANLVLVESLGFMEIDTNVSFSVNKI